MNASKINKKTVKKLSRQVGSFLEGIHLRLHPPYYTGCLTGIDKIRQTRDEGLGTGDSRLETRGQRQEPRD